MFLVPDQCHDMHGGQSPCEDYDKLLVAGDQYVHQLVAAITSSKGWDANSAIIIAWDENDYTSNIGCCASVFPHGGGHTALIVITKGYKQPIEIATPSNHYNELRSIEDAFGLPHINNSATQVPSLNPLLYPGMGLNARFR
jgi:hypothetical protein